MGAAQNNMGSGKFELLVKQCAGNYDIKGGQMVFRFDNATFRSRRKEHGVSRIELSGGRVVKRGRQQRVDGWGASKCRNWLKMVYELWY